MRVVSIRAFSCHMQTFIGVHRKDLSRVQWRTDIDYGFPPRNLVPLTLTSPTKGTKAYANSIHASRRGSIPEKD